MKRVRICCSPPLCPALLIGGQNAGDGTDSEVWPDQPDWQWGNRAADVWIYHYYEVVLMISRDLNCYKRPFFLQKDIDKELFIEHD